MNNRKKLAELIRLYNKTHHTLIMYDPESNFTQMFQKQYYHTLYNSGFDYLLYSEGPKELNPHEQEESEKDLYSHSDAPAIPQHTEKITLLNAYF
jgi:hypothetical protein